MDSTFSLDCGKLDQCLEQCLSLVNCNSNIHYNLIITTKFNDALILITTISCDYLNLTLANEYVNDVTTPTQVIMNNQNFLQANQPIRLQYSNQIKLFKFIYQNVSNS